MLFKNLWYIDEDIGIYKRNENGKKIKHFTPVIWRKIEASSVEKRYFLENYNQRKQEIFIKKKTQKFEVLGFPEYLLYILV